MFLVGAIFVLAFLDALPAWSRVWIVLAIIGAAIS